MTVGRPGPGLAVYRASDNLSYRNVIIIRVCVAGDAARRAGFARSTAVAFKLSTTTEGPQHKGAAAGRRRSMCKM